LLFIISHDHKNVHKKSQTFLFFFDKKRLHASDIHSHNTILAKNMSKSDEAKAKKRKADSGRPKPSSSAVDLE